ncbi:uncharacterized protein N7459_001606, partial [Penicillium hispanicum]|uniref:uncharacterized protein n=1 Tax=Penicillium hispanicum TaxID=1080232 RepID=UPI0025403D8B
MPRVLQSKNLEAFNRTGTEVLTCRLSSLIARYHRRRTYQRSSSESHDITPPMEQVCVERWLEQQNNPRDAQQYAHDTCPICLSSLSSSPYLPLPKAAHLPSSGGDSSAAISDNVSPPHGEMSVHDNCIIVLNQCHHAFHLTCLTSWFEYRHYKCPLCQAAYSPAET